MRRVFDAGDAIENVIAERFDTFPGKWRKEYSSNFVRRAMTDIAFKDKEDCYCIVDVKTNREDTKFNLQEAEFCENRRKIAMTAIFQDQGLFAMVAWFGAALSVPMDYL